jgi:hypothetical protein
MRQLIVLLLALISLGCSEKSFNEKMDEDLALEKIKFYTVTINDIDHIYKQLKAKGKNSSCAIFAFFPQVRDKSNHIEIQYCIENNVVGLDWVFLGEVKERDKDLFIDYIENHNQNIKSLEMNNVKYLRVTGENIPELLVGFLTDIYALKPIHKFELVASQFDVQGLNYSTHDLYSEFYSQQ